MKIFITTLLCLFYTNATIAASKIEQLFHNYNETVRYQSLRGTTIQSWVDNTATTIHRNVQSLSSFEKVIKKFRLVNANDGNIGQTLITPLKDNDIINLKNYASSTNQYLNIEAIVSSTSVGSFRSIRFVLMKDGKIVHQRVEDTAPHSLCGDRNGIYSRCVQLVVGTYTLTATPYSGIDGKGIAGKSRTISFSIIDKSLPAAWIEVNTNIATIEERHEACFVMVGRKAYLLAGRHIKHVNIYDPITRRWTKGVAPPIEIHHTQCVVVGTSIWIVSSWTGNFPKERNTDSIYIYNTVKDKWLTKPGLPEERRRGGAASVLVGNKIYVSHGNRGGHETGNFATTLGWLDYYDIDQGRWYTNLPDAPNQRDHTGGAFINGRICIAGGRNGGEINFFNNVVLPTDCYDPIKNKWTVEANIPQGRAGSSYGTTCDGKLIVAGGEGFGRAYSNVDIFDGKTWTSIDNLNVGRHGSGLAVDCICEQIHIASGARTQGGSQEIKSVETLFANGVDVPCLE